MRALGILILVLLDNSSSLDSTAAVEKEQIGLFL